MLVLGTFILVAIGGTVTSYDVGMAVPEGFNTFGYWSLTAPLEVWWHDFGTRLEHGHRLKGYVVGWLTIGVLVGVLLTQRGRGRVQWLAWVLLVYVIAQGVLGILRVDEVSLVLAAMHGVTGQGFLALTVLMTVMLGRRWIEREAEWKVDLEKDQTLRSADYAQRRRGGGVSGMGRVPVSTLVLLVLLFVQLSLGAAVRHSYSAVSIPDWPLHYGSVLPPMTQEAVDTAVAGASARYADKPAFDPDRDGTYAAWQVHLHFTHRLGAYTIFAYCVWFLGRCERRYKGDRSVLVPVRIFGTLLLVQIGLGVMTVWSAEHPTFATLHQTTGAVMIGCATWLCARLKLAQASRTPREPGRLVAVSTTSTLASTGAPA